MKVKTLALVGAIACLMLVAPAAGDAPGHTITPPSDQTAEATGPSGAIVTYPHATVDPNDEPVTCSPASGSQFPLGPTTVTCSAEDAADATFTVTVTDTTAPTVTVPADISDSSTDPGGKTINYGPVSASDVVDGSLTPTCSPASGSNFPIGATTVTCSATDSHGNTGSASFTVTVSFSDTTPPTFTSVPSPITVEATGPAGAVVGYSVTASDNSGKPPTINCSPASGSTFPITTTTVNCTATDAAGNHADTSFTVTVHDTTAPHLNLPGNITAEADSTSGKVVTYSASSTDAVSGSPAVSCSPASGTTFHLGTTTVNCSASDGAGNTAQGSFTVTITDNSPPTFSGTPADRQVEANGPGGSIITYTKPTATDTLDGPIAIVNCAPASGTLFPLGTTTVDCSASDSHGNVGHATFQIRVADTTPPTLSVPGPTTVYATTPTGIPETEQGIQSFRAAAFASDIVDPHPVIGDDLGSFAEVGVHTVNFRARDASGNAQVKSTTLTVLPEPPAGTPQRPPPPSAKPPADPPKLQIFPGDGFVRLVWGAVAGAAQYVVYRSENTARRLAAGGHGQVVYTGKATTYTDRGLTNGVEYRYVVAAQDAAGNESAGVAAAAAPRRDLLRAPKDGVNLRKPPKLVWLRNSEASYYNVQVFRGQTKILSKWPVSAALVLQRDWKFEGKRYKLTPGVYQWYVWPGFGSRSAIDYGELLGSRTFRIVR